MLDSSAMRVRDVVAQKNVMKRPSAIFDKLMLPVMAHRGPPPMRVTTWILPLSMAFLSASMPTHAIEEPVFEVTAKLGDVEIRQYAPYVVAEVLVTGFANEAGNKGFRILAGYIFGKNKGERRLAELRRSRRPQHRSSWK